MWYASVTKWSLFSFFLSDRILMRLQIFPQMKIIINKNKKQNKKWFRVGVVGHRQFLGWFNTPFGRLLGWPNHPPQPTVVGGSATPIIDQSPKVLWSVRATYARVCGQPPHSKPIFFFWFLFFFLIFKLLISAKFVIISLQGQTSKTNLVISPC